jgi:hypothetical protein
LAEQSPDTPLLTAFQISQIHFFQKGTLMPNLFRTLIDRLTGWPLITVRYRSHWRVMAMAHKNILQLIEDNADGDARRGSLADWCRAERPVLDALRGTTSLFRIDGPRQFIGHDMFAMGSLIESPGVTAHLDPIDTLHLEERMRKAIETEILRWIDERKLQDCPPVDASVDRATADPRAIARMLDWVERDRWQEVATYAQ